MVLRAQQEQARLARIKARAEAKQAREEHLRNLYIASTVSSQNRSIEVAYP